MAVNKKAPISGQTSFQTSNCSEMFLVHPIFQDRQMTGGRGSNCIIKSCRRTQYNEVLAIDSYAFVEV